MTLEDAIEATSPVGGVQRGLIVWFLRSRHSRAQDYLDYAKIRQPIYDVRPEELAAFQARLVGRPPVDSRAVLEYAEAQAAAEAASLRIALEPERLVKAPLRAYEAQLGLAKWGRVAGLVRVGDLLEAAIYLWAEDLDVWPDLGAWLDFLFQKCSPPGYE